MVVSGTYASHIRIALVATFHRRPGLIHRIAEALREQTRPPDELWLLCETDEDREALASEEWPGEANLRQIPVPAGVVPPSYQINVALDESQADAFAYLTDDSLPHPEKYERMAVALEEHGAVYCSQGFGDAASHDQWLSRVTQPRGFRQASGPCPQPFCVVDHTQVAHRRSEDRWPTAMSELRHSDGRFFQALVARFGPLHPIPEVLDFTCQLPDGISAR